MLPVVELPGLGASTLWRLEKMLKPALPLPLCLRIDASYCPSALQASAPSLCGCLYRRLATLHWVQWCVASQRCRPLKTTCAYGERLGMAGEVCTAVWPLRELMPGAGRQASMPPLNCALRCCHLGARRSDMTATAQTFNSPLWSYDPSAALLVRQGTSAANACMAVRMAVFAFRMCCCTSSA